MWLLWLACAPGPTVAGTPEIGSPMCPPWDRLELTLDAAEITYCDPERLVIHLPPGRADALGPSFRTAVREAGWDEDLDSSASGMVNVRYDQGGDRLALSILDDGPETVAILTIVRR